MIKFTNRRIAALSSLETLFTQERLFLKDDVASKSESRKLRPF